MAYNISLSTVKAQLSNFVEECTECATTMKLIDAVYVDATSSEWNTPAAGQYIDGLCSAFNNFSSQFNSKYDQGLQSFVDGVNVLAKHEEANLVSKPALTTLPQLAKNWTPQSEDFNVPQDYASFTSSHLTVNIDRLIEHVESMQGCIDTAVENGLDASFCTTLRTELNALKKSAQEVAKEYDGKAAQAAVEQDTAVSTIQSNT